jgi:ribonuclease PH
MPRERKGVAERKSNLRFPYKLFIVASEGADTERIYFEAVAQLAAANIHKRANIKIEYLNRLSEAERKESGHTKVVAQLDEYKKKITCSKKPTNYGWLSTEIKIIIL